MFEDPETFFMQLMLKQHVKCMKKNIRQFVMAEWDRLVELCSNDLPVFVLEKKVDGAYASQNRKRLVLNLNDTQ